MKAKDLISVLEKLDPNTDVYFKPENSSYVEDFGGTIRNNITINSFWGNDYKAAVLVNNSQVGSV